LGKTDYLNVTLEELLAPLDLVAVSSAMQESEGINRLTSFDLLEAKDMVLLAADTWLARDLQEFEGVEIEKEYKDGKARLDLVATHRGTMAPFDKTPGGKTIIDWKTTGSPVDTESYKQRIVLDYSWQWKNYASCVPESSLFIYRSISRDAATYRGKGANEKPAVRTREFILEINRGHQEEIDFQWKGVESMRDGLVGFDVWPRNFGRDNCFAYGIECPFYDDCLKNRMPLEPLLVDKFKELSYTKMKLFMLCPERYRRTVLGISTTEDPIEKDSDATAFGSVVHTGLGELWRQAFEKANHCM
jgi:hypothetical protein